MSTGGDLADDAEALDGAPTAGGTPEMSYTALSVNHDPRLLGWDGLLWSGEDWGGFEVGQSDTAADSLDGSAAVTSNTVPSMRQLLNSNEEGVFDPPVGFEAPPSSDRKWLVGLEPLDYAPGGEHGFSASDAPMPQTLGLEVPDTRPDNQLSDSGDQFQAESNPVLEPQPSARVPIGRLPSAANFPTTRDRYSCNFKDCQTTCSRLADLERHQQTVHGPGVKHYHCAVPGCNAQNRRLDHMREHCRKVHGHASKQELVETVSNVSVLEYGCRFPSCSLGAGPHS